MGDFNQSKYINDFIKETYDTIKVQVPKGQKELIKEHAKKKGFKSVNEYMKDLIAQDMERTGEKQGIHIQFQPTPPARTETAILHKKTNNSSSHFHNQITSYPLKSPPTYPAHIQSRFHCAVFPVRIPP